LLRNSTIFSAIDRRFPDVALFVPNAGWLGSKEGAIGKPRVAVNCSLLA
jgi:hypothetical protein